MWLSMVAFIVTLASASSWRRVPPTRSRRRKSLASDISRSAPIDVDQVAGSPPRYFGKVSVSSGTLRVRTLEFIPIKL
jgi:hypothetical protein